MNIKWGDIVSIIPPGFVGLCATYSYTGDRIISLLKAEEISGFSHFGIALILTMVIGGVIDATRRLLIDEIIIRKSALLLGKQTHPQSTVFYHIKDKDSLEVFQAGVELWQFFTFYANLSLSFFLFYIMQVIANWFSLLNTSLLVIALLLLSAAYVQFKYYDIFSRAFIIRKNKSKS